MLKNLVMALVILPALFVSGGVRAGEGNLVMRVNPVVGSDLSQAHIDFMTCQAYAARALSTALGCLARTVSNTRAGPCG